VPEIIVRAAARRELKTLTLYLREHGGADVAERFLAAVRETFETLASMPDMGLLCGFRRRATRRMRRFPVQGAFENWLVFYLPKRGGIEVVHILHGARDIESLLDG
jgi:toxin ParE1/3/4